MKEICGYVDIDGYFHKTEKECKLADTRSTIKKLESKLDNFQKEVGWLISKHASEGASRDEVHYILRLEDKIYESVAKLILAKHEDWQKLLSEHEDIKEKLDELYLANVGKWWLKFKWWK